MCSLTTEDRCYKDSLLVPFQEFSHSSKVFLEGYMQLQMGKCLEVCLSWKSCCHSSEGKDSTFKLSLTHLPDVEVCRLSVFFGVSICDDDILVVLRELSPCVFRTF